jgi:hypothetical protein
VVLVVTVAFNGRYAGAKSKLDPVEYTGDLNIMTVASNLPSNFAGSAVIENLIIDGKKMAGTTGIVLQNVYNCLIRNITIMDCEVGIRVKVTEGFLSHGNRFEHIRMINVKTGIVFEGTSSSMDFSYTTIDDVRINLSGVPNAVGIKLGGDTSYANLYNAFIKAAVWLQDFAHDGSSHKGLEVVKGALKFSLVNFEVEQHRPDPVPLGYLSGYGVYINSGAAVSSNQNFLLTTLGLDFSGNNSGSDRRIGGSIVGNDVDIVSQ